MIATTIREDSRPPALAFFPRLKLLKTNDGDVVVLFVSDGRGFVVASNSRHYCVGYEGNFWTHTDFQEFSGSVELQNMRSDT